MGSPIKSSVVIITLSLASLHAVAEMPETIVSLDGKCGFRINNQNLDCEGKLVYSKFANHRVAFTAFPTLLAGVDFSGEKDVQPVPESYMLTVDHLILSGGTTVPADGFCSMDLRADGQRVYSVTCKALAHDGRSFELDFKPSDKPPSILHPSDENPTSDTPPQLNECQSAIVLDGIASRGSLVCNPAWLDRKGSYAILAKAQACKGIAKTRALLARGFSDFERKLKELGKETACKQIDDLIKSME